jgi:hypothetical protein
MIRSRLTQKCVTSKANCFHIAAVLFCLVDNLGDLSKSGFGTETRLSIAETVNYKLIVLATTHRQLDQNSRVRRIGDGTMSVMESEATYDLTDERWTVALSVARSAAAVLEYDRDALKRFWTEAINEGQVGPVIREWAQLVDRLSDVIEMTLTALEHSKQVLEDLGYPPDDDDLLDSRLN